MTQICMHPHCGAPIQQNAPYGSWRIIHVLSGEDISPLAVYADDSTGDLWRFVENNHGGIIRSQFGAPEIEKLNLGSGGLRLKQV